MNLDLSKTPRQQLIVATFRTFFHGRLSGFEITCLKSFLDFGHRVIVFTYDGVDIPELFEKADAACLLPRDRLFLYKSEPGRGSVAAFSNLFRYMLLERYGDWWIDTDVLCLTASWPEADGSPVAGWQDEDAIGTGVLALPTGLARMCAAKSSALGQNVMWGQTGPQLVTQLFRECRLVKTALEPTAFYPVHWSRWTDPFDPEEQSSTKAACASSMAVHLWHELIRRSGFDKEWRPPNDTFFGQAIARHATTTHFVPLGREDYVRQIAFHKAEMIRHLREMQWCAEESTGE